jgi:hypothetical protein
LPCHELISNRAMPLIQVKGGKSGLTPTQFSESTFKQFR